jgi:hypothetical protein
MLAWFLEEAHSNSPIKMGPLFQEMLSSASHAGASILSQVRKFFPKDTPIKGTQYPLATFSICFFEGADKHIGLFEPASRDRILVLKD